jgi:hypothetical protein
VLSRPRVRCYPVDFFHQPCGTQIAKDAHVPDLLPTFRIARELAQWRNVGRSSNIKLD